jgi:hypothetical protein
MSSAIIKRLRVKVTRQIDYGKELHKEGNKLSDDYKEFSIKLWLLCNWFSHPVLPHTFRCPHMQSQGSA